MQITKIALVIVGVLVTALATPAVRSQSGAPKITLAYVSGKKLMVQGAGFESGATVSINGAAEKTHNDSKNPTTMLVVKKGGKKIHGLPTVVLTVKNPDGTTSDPYSLSIAETVLTLANDGQTINLKVGDQLFVYLGTTYHWMLQPYDTNILGQAFPGAGTLIVGAQAWLKAINPGQTTLSLVGDPPCHESTPPCEQPSRLFSVQVVVSQ
jgi:hypothetical protein